MLRIGKFNINRPKLVPHFARQMYLAKRLISAKQLQLSGNFSKDRGSTDQRGEAGKSPKKPGIGDHDKNPNIVTTQRWPRKIFSGIQPTGSLHLGNYLGAVRKWTQLQKARENLTVCIVDMHSITLPHNPPQLRENIFVMAATLLACGIDPAHTTLFVQSAVMEHCELNWILNSVTTMPRLAQLPQFKDKTRTVRDVPLGLYVYPVLQAADIMLYKATHVPVGMDQLQHIQLAQHLTRCFNTRYGEMFPVCNPMIEENDGSRILSLREPSKKMSKSDMTPKATICLNDSPEHIRDKIKKALTDFTSDISYAPNTRPGVSNLVNIHALVSGQSIETVIEEAEQLDTAKYKERVSDAVIEHLRPIRENINTHLSNRNELAYMLEMGADKARKVAKQTMCDVKQRLGLGTTGVLPASVNVPPPLPDHSRLTATQRMAKGAMHPDANAHSMPHFEQRCEPGRVGFAANPGGDAGDTVTGKVGHVDDTNVHAIRRPIVPTQSMRVEKSFNRSPSRHVFRLDTFNVPKMDFRDTSFTSVRSEQRVRRPKFLGFMATPNLNTVNSISGFKYGSSNSSALAAVTSQVNAAYKQQETISSLANSAFYKAAASSFNSTSPSVVNVAINSTLNRINTALTNSIKPADSSPATTSNSSGNSSEPTPIDVTTASSAADEEEVEQLTDDEEDEENLADSPQESKVEKVN